MKLEESMNENRNIPNQGLSEYFGKEVPKMSNHHVGKVVNVTFIRDDIRCTIQDVKYRGPKVYYVIGLTYYGIDGVLTYTTLEAVSHMVEDAINDNIDLICKRDDKMIFDCDNISPSFKEGSEVKVKFFRDDIKVKVYENIDEGSNVIYENNELRYYLYFESRWAGDPLDVSRDRYVDTVVLISSLFVEH